VPAGETLEASGQPLAEAAAASAPSGSRWMAEAVALTPEEAGMLLENEMFRTFAAAPGDALESEQATDQAPPVTAGAETGPAETDVASGSAAAAEVVAESAPAVSPSEVPAETESPSAAVAAEPTAAIIEQDVEQKASLANVTSEEPEQAPAATFADAVAQLEAEAFLGASAATESTEIPPNELVAAADRQQVPNLESGGAEDMAKDGKGKSSKSSGRQSHKPAGDAAPVDAVEAAEPVLVAEEAPKAMAAAATAESVTAPAPDANAIASIVDSVLADLRPKIVEEIAKKLAGK